MADDGDRADASPRSPPERWVAELSGSPIEDEYRFVARALEQCAPLDRRFEAARYAPAALAKARAFWAEAAAVEYGSADTFVDLSMQARSIDAPIDTQTVLLRMAQDELRHGALCARVAAAMGGERRIAAPPVRRPARHADCGPEEQLLRDVIYGCCLGEVVNAARLAKRLGETADPFVREALRALLTDERLHAQFGFHYLESRRGWLAARPDVRRRLARYLRFAFAALEQQMGAVPIGVPPPGDEERALGLPDLTEASATFQEIIANASVPGLERFDIDAGPSWRERTLVPPAAPRAR